ncbi:glutamine synthetase III [bacterium]|nr:glutamine synthetase III [bacterium]
MGTKPSDIFGVYVFNDSAMRERLPKETYKKLKKTIENGEPLEIETAEVVANAMKDWAIEKGATHYTHWFQPLTGKTAEKHDSFISLAKDGKTIMEFSGKNLIQGEPDASSFPNGGLRATFEARGYTAWDCTSPAFVKEEANGMVLYIPTAFCSYNGEALDEKTPLLRSMETLSKSAQRVLKLIGRDDVKKVYSTVGAEQEYFIIDKEFFNKRLDLLLTGRTLLGALPPKGQELEDHYFGAIKERVASFMNELDIELWKLGVASKTKHNEVAPAQHEIAPIFENVNVATDHNQLVMETLHKVAERHNLAALLHEKPFAGVNGSGKHNNWSLSTDLGENLLEPGKNPEKNLVFQLFTATIISAIDEYAPLLRLSASNPGNEHRLGANEAPPAIISVYLGEELEKILCAGIFEAEQKTSQKNSIVEISVSTLPKFEKDSTDRNRTSPFAFTGNKFEFRMVPSSASIAMPNITLNTVVAEMLSRVADMLESDKSKKSIENKVLLVINTLMKKHHKILFSGNGYSNEWVIEAEKRGLPNLKSMVDALPYLTSEESINLFTKHSVFTSPELHSRQEILYDEYAKVIRIESLTMIEMVRREIFPVLISVLKEYSVNDKSYAFLQKMGDQLSTKTEMLYESLVQLELLTEEGESITNPLNKALFYQKNIKDAMNKVREISDKIEKLVPKNRWPFPDYTDLLFRV